MKERGFTLIEVLIAIAVLVILGTVVLAAGGGARQRARDAKRISDITQLQVALEGFFNAPIKNKHYPASLQELITDGYISKLPKDPSNNSDYGYIAGAADSNGNSTAYCLAANLEDDNHPEIQRSSNAVPCDSFDPNVYNYRILR